jgi:hypothetical protein
MIQALGKDAILSLQPGGTVDDMIPLMFKKLLVRYFFESMFFSIQVFFPPVFLEAPISDVLTLLDAKFVCTGDAVGIHVGIHNTYGTVGTCVGST